ncbi:hypothetical protein P170DRAFT_426407 [Aspergillus steynii IBT 23096]|uniref:Serine-rich protein n=1 Tax=Aspergillus steynii IBT 23096 TaxID=1392250 RepID=A0A2I2G9E7_9EURO|nr:uncharacterized protein P170DRAFT_426407 [Aspergillus steynii IBT 23096]PLB49502.1 hypothetical protein P170DRAFT_426407 [Aspergillus steynii IBT 23096]
MRSSEPSASSSPRRKALHERTPSQTNETSPPESLRVVSDKHSDPSDEDDIYTATPYPTKPEHILLPRPGKGHEFIPDSRFHVDEAPHESTGTLSTDISHVGDSSLIEHSIGDPWDLSSTFDAANTPSQVWEDDPSSSKSSFPEPNLPEHKSIDRRSDEDSVAAYSDEDPIALPAAIPTIKTVASDLSSRQPSHPENATSSNSSPNVVPIGPPSSPNFVALDSSSLNFVPLGASSNPDSGSRSNSLSSLNSLGTVIRYAGAAPWAHGSSSEQSSSRSHSFRSNPAHPYVPSVRSSSARLRERSHSRSATSSRSDPPTDVQGIVDGGLFIQYPTIREPSSSSSRVDVTNVSDSSNQNQQEPMADHSSDRFKSHLSTVTSRWSAEYDSRSPTPADEPIEGSQEPSRPTAAVVRQKPTSSSLWLVSDVDNEHMDNVANLPARAKHSRFHPSLSSASRQSSMRSTTRPPTSFHFLPTWARMYYGDGQTVNSALSLVDGARPPSARPASSKPNTFERMSAAVNRQRTRTNETRQSIQWRAPDPRDPRSHWLRRPEDEERPGSSRQQLRHSWSPHLFPDRRAIRQRGSAWGAPSLDSRTEPLFGRRNIQVWSFCLGFVFPFAWLIAAFLPLPPKPEMTEEEQSEPELEAALRMRLLDLERRRHENARWWRNLNRWMIPVGLVIIVIVVPASGANFP